MTRIPTLIINIIYDLITVFQSENIMTSQLVTSSCVLETSSESLDSLLSSDSELWSHLVSLCI